MATPGTVLEFPRSFFDQLDDELTRSVRIINQHMRKSFDTTKISKEELQIQLDAADKEAGTTEKTTRWEGETLIVEWGQAPIKTTVRITLSPIDRLKDKLKQASGVAQRVAIQVEAEADSLIAREDQLKTKTTQAFAPHKAILDQASTELDQVENALNLLSNGGPALDPLPSSAPPAQGS